MYKNQNKISVFCKRIRYFSVDIAFKRLLITIFALTYHIVFSNNFIDSSKCKICGVYVSAPNKIERILKSIVKGVNAVVIDIKDDFGNITYDLESDKYKPYYKTAPKIRNIISELKARGIYTIARIVAFKDKKKTSSDHKMAIMNNNGTLYVDKEKMSWLNPYKSEVQDYLIDIAKLVADAGFDEVQFDYIRFSHYNSMLQHTNVWKEIKRKSKIKVINEFLSKTVKILHKKGVKMSVDVFGCIIPESIGTYKSDSENLGQDYVEIANIVDYICPMIYPSHWPANSCGVPKPDLDPYKITNIVMKLSHKALGNNQKKVRPWLQAFTARWLKKGMWKKYRIKEIQEQINASTKNDVSGICLWNPQGNYVF